MKPFRIVFSGKPVGFSPLKFSEENKKYLPDRTYVGWVKEARAHVDVICEAAGITKPFDEALFLRITSFSASWKNFSRTQNRMAATDEFRPLFGPSLLDIERAVYDACKDLVFEDFNQIIGVELNNKFAHEITPRVEVVFSPWPR